MSNPIILIVVDIVFEILFDGLVESFYLSIGLGIKSCKKFAIYSEFCDECYEESRSKSRASIYYKLVWQSMVADDLSDNDIRKILYWMGFVGRRELAIFNKTIHCDKDTIITSIADRVFGLR